MVQQRLWFIALRGLGLFAILGINKTKRKTGASRRQTIAGTVSTNLKKYIYILVVLLTWSCLGQWNGIEKNETQPKETKTENFKLFLENFSLNKDFQLSRIQFPISDCEYIGTYASPCDEIEKEKWIHLILVDTTRTPATITDIYDNFELEMKNSGERVLAFEATETNVCRYYFFKAVREKWFLEKIMTCVD
ncbi:DUF4348 domain-containing protein [Muriicola jejuensis]|uniref:DUF4348 domain-containing protein n=1 Tax=Muriicola jejuensis TaxID=504488 RepID=A0A6P0UEV8_9FLAO|nr:DUF4348 domain-containing protein [Muriicola jejuensis]NER11775.1 DUF4348 domain-containing protein [Muriicola jejuensis]